MPYALPLIQINANIRGLVIANTTFGFGTGTFHTLLMSYWMCGPTGVGGTAAIWPEFATSANFFAFASGTNGLKLTNQTVTSSPFYQGTISSLPPPAGVLMHFLLSVDTHAQVVQLYVNDVATPITGGTWTGAQPLDFHIYSIANNWFWNVSGVLLSGLYPALADVWITNPPAFVDLSVTANRRKFINADLTAVDLGTTGTNPFGTAPNIYMTVRPAGVATDMLINHGSGGGTWNADQNPPTVQAPGSCSLPTPPPPPPPRLAIDNVVVDATATLLEVNLVSLRWSDDRGHSWGSPVTQDIGEAGEYRTSLQWQRLAYARDRCFEVSWSVPMRTALQGCWVDVTPAQS